MTPDELANKHHERWDDHFNRQNEAAMKAAEGALKSLLLINGGAVVSMLAFLGAMISKDVSKVPVFASPLSMFAWGVVLASAGFGFSYLANFSQAGRTSSFDQRWDPPYIRPGKYTFIWTLVSSGWHILAVFSALGALVSFLLGTRSVSTLLSGLQ